MIVLLHAPWVLGGGVRRTFGLQKPYETTVFEKKAESNNGSEKERTNNKASRITGPKAGIDAKRHFCSMSLGKLVLIPTTTIRK